MPRFVGPIQLLWAYLGFIVVAELFTAIDRPQFGVGIHAIILCVLVIQGGLARFYEVRTLALALTLVPLMRVVSMSVPLSNFPQLAWYPIVGLPLLMTAGMIIRRLALAPRDLGLRLRGLPLQILLMGIGLPLGVLGYAIAQPPVLPLTSWQSISLSIVIFIIFTGFGEELIFRGLIQSLALPVFGRWTLVYTSLLFSGLHIGYRSVTFIIFVLGVSLLFAHIVYWSGSIIGVTVAHGLTNVTLYLIMPQLIQLPVGPYHSYVVWVIAIEAVLASIAVTILILRAEREGRLFISNQSLSSALRIAKASGSRSVPNRRQLRRGANAAGAPLSQPSTASWPASIVRGYTSSRQGRSTFTFAILLLVWEVAVLTTRGYVLPNLLATLELERLVKLSGAVIICTVSGAIIFQVFEVCSKILSADQHETTSIVHRRPRLLLTLVVLLTAVLGIALGLFLIPSLQRTVATRQFFMLAMVALFCVGNGALTFWLISAHIGMFGGRLQRRSSTTGKRSSSGRQA